MDTVTTTGRADGVLALTAHPLQRCGALAVAELAARESPAELSAADLDGVATRLVEDVVAVSSLPKNEPNPDWWKILFALYPNAKPTHAARTRDAGLLRASVAGFFEADDEGRPGLPCTFCSAVTPTLWAKAYLPMFDSMKALNTLPPGSAGWPVCRGCRVAMWALPYGAWVTLGSATVLMCANSEVERHFVRKNVRRARQIQQFGFSSVPADACAEVVTLTALRALAADAPADAVLWSFKNDNQEPWLRTTVTRQAIGRLLARIGAEPASRRGWARLRRALAARDKQGRGYAAIARTLFDEEQQGADRLLRALYREFLDLPSDPVAVDGWRRLARAYQEEIYGMDVDRLAPAARLIADWITAERNPRGRFNEYTRAASNERKLGELLRLAGARLYLDGKPPPNITAVLPGLLSRSPDGWRLRTQLFFEVLADLTGARVSIGGKPDDGDQNEDEPLSFEIDEEEEYA